MTFSSAIRPTVLYTEPDAVWVVSGRAIARLERRIGSVRPFTLREMETLIGPRDPAAVLRQAALTARQPSAAAIARAMANRGARPLALGWKVRLGDQSAVRPLLAEPQALEGLAIAEPLCGDEFKRRLLDALASDGAWQASARLAGRRVRAWLLGWLDTHPDARPGEAHDILDLCEEGGKADAGTLALTCKLGFVYRLTDRADAAGVLAGLIGTSTVEPRDLDLYFSSHRYPHAIPAMLRHASDYPEALRFHAGVDLGLGSPQLWPLWFAGSDEQKASMLSARDNPLSLLWLARIGRLTSERFEHVARLEAIWPGEPGHLSRDGRRIIPVGNTLECPGRQAVLDADTGRALCPPVPYAIISPEGTFRLRRSGHSLLLENLRAGTSRTIPGIDPDAVWQVQICEGKLPVAAVQNGNELEMVELSSGTVRAHWSKSVALHVDEDGRVLRTTRLRSQLCDWQNGTSLYDVNFKGFDSFETLRAPNGLLMLASMSEPWLLLGGAKTLAEGYHDFPALSPDGRYLLAGGKLTDFETNRSEATDFGGPGTFIGPRLWLDRELGFARIRRVPDGQLDTRVARDGGVSYDNAVRTLCVSGPAGNAVFQLHPTLPAVPTDQTLLAELWLGYRLDGQRPVPLSAREHAERRLRWRALTGRDWAWAGQHGST